MKKHIQINCGTANSKQVISYQSKNNCKNQSKLNQIITNVCIRYNSLNKQYLDTC